jgi:adenosylmethionine---8-amino-7-oxononanoate aminotransferase
MSIHIRRWDPNFGSIMTTSLSERDVQVIWHPYTQHKNGDVPVAAVSGEGALIFDENGNSYIDAVSSWWVNIHGHGHPYLAERIYEQAKKLEHIIFTSFTHEPAVQLAERLLKILPGDFSKVFYSDNGSTAVEVAVKMAIQFWWNQSKPRIKILAFKNSYHGDTFGAMSVSSRSIFTVPFQGHLFEVIFIETPTHQNLGELKSFLHQNHSEFAAFIYEPLLQAAGGMLTYDAGLMDELLGTVKFLGVIQIADEVMTGFGRTGKMFACEYLKNKPDIICLSKGLTGGTMALSVTAATKRIFEAFLSEDREKTFFHGHSFTANPIACSAALASLDLLEKESCWDKIEFISGEHRKFADRLRKYKGIKDIRTLGTVVAFTLNTGSDGYMNKTSGLVTARSLEAGIYLRPLGNTIYIMPPYCITGAQLDQVYEFLIRFAENFS